MRAKIRRKILEKAGNHLWVADGRHDVLGVLGEIGVHVCERIQRGGELLLLVVVRSEEEKAVVGRGEGHCLPLSATAFGSLN